LDDDAMNVVALPVLRDARGYQDGQQLAVYTQERVVSPLIAQSATAVFARLADPKRTRDAYRAPFINLFLSRKSDEAQQDYKERNEAARTIMDRFASQPPQVILTTVKPPGGIDSRAQAFVLRSHDAVLRNVIFIRYFVHQHLHRASAPDRVHQLLADGPLWLCWLEGITEHEIGHMMQWEVRLLGCEPARWLSTS
jgi:hypothetical protein